MGGSSAPQVRRFYYIVGKEAAGMDCAVGLFLSVKHLFKTNKNIPLMDDPVLLKCTREKQRIKYISKK